MTMNNKMPKYINADELIKAIETELWDWKTVDGIKSSTVLKQTISDIKNMPSADVVEVVRCKDCKHRRQVDDTWFYCEEIYSNMSGLHKRVDDDFYCKDGERKGDN